MSNSNQQCPIPQVSLADNTVRIRNSENGVGILVYSYHPLEILEPVSVYDSSIGNTSGLSIIPIFNGDDFREWKRKVLAYFNLAKAAYALTNTMPQTVGTGDTAIAPDLKLIKEWKSSNAQALGLFQLKLSPTLQWIIKTTAKETWDTLKAEYNVPSLLEVFTFFQGLTMCCTQMFVSNKGKNLTFDNILPFIKQEYNRRHMDGVTTYATQISSVQRYTGKSLNWNRQKKFHPCNPNPNPGNNQNQNSGNQGNKGKQPAQPQQSQQKSNGKKNNKKKSNKKGKGKKPNGAILVMIAEITDLPQKEEPQSLKKEKSSNDGKVLVKCVNHFCTSPDKTIYGIFITG
uniref:Uncharacterized protein n=1 Tax=Moniliophthora roreri TaxID=221103 RepID=A0A0W0F344_MONRR